MRIMRDLFLLEKWNILGDNYSYSDNQYHSIFKQMQFCLNTASLCLYFYCEWHHIWSVCEHKFFFCSTGVCIQGLTHTRQVLLLMSYILKFFYFCFEIKSSLADLKLKILLLQQPSTMPLHLAINFDKFKFL